MKMPGDVCQLHRPFTKLGPDLADPEWLEQDGVLFCWSESNCQFERAWWLSDTAVDCDLVRHLRKTRQPPKVNG